MATVYEIARALKMPGMVIRAHLDPTQLTTRVFNGTRKMLASGVVTGHGASAGIARALFKKHEVNYVAHNKWGIYRRGTINFTPEDVEQVTEMYAAYIALRKMESMHGMTGYWDDRLRDLKKWIQHAASGTTGNLYMTLENAPYRDRIAEIMTSRFDPHHIEGRQQLLTRFEAGERFDFDVVNWSDYE